MEPPAASDNYRATSFKRPPPGSLVVLLPASDKDKDLAVGVTMMSDQLGRQLQAAGYRVAALDAKNYDEIWKQEIAAIGGIFDPASGEQKPREYAAARSNLARRICDEAKCSLVVQQRLVLRKATLGGASAEWDGQRRRVRVTKVMSNSYSFSGSTYGLSVELVILKADGEPVLRTYGGASLPFQTDALQAQNELRPDLFADDVEIADGVRLALKPLLDH